MKNWRRALRDCVFSGSVASVATTAALAACGARESQNALAPINAVSHIVWGDEAARQETASLKYTLVGLKLNAAACVSWALIYETLCGEASEESLAAALGGGALVATLAYVVDYHVVSKRLTPGFEKRLSPRALFAIYFVLGLSLAASSRVREKS